MYGQIKPIKIKKLIGSNKIMYFLLISHNDKFIHAICRNLHLDHNFINYYIRIEIEEGSWARSKPRRCFIQRL